MNYFDRISRRSAPVISPYTPVVSPYAPDAGIDASLYGAGQPLEYLQAQDDPFAGLPEDDWVEIPAPQQPQDQAPQQAAPQYQAPQAAPQPAPQQPQAAPYVPPIPQGPQQTTLSPEARARTIKFNRDIATLVNGGASREQIMARVAEEKKFAPNADVIGLDEVLAWREQNPGVSIPVGIAGAPDQPEPEPVYGEDRGQVEAFLDGAADSILLGAKDEIAGALRATVNSGANLVGLGTGESWGDTYARERDEERQIARDAQHYNPGTRLLGQVGGGLLTVPVGGQAALASGGRAAAARLAAEGATLGGVYGFNSADGDLGERLGGAGAGAAVGVAGALALGVPANAIARRIGANRAAPSEGRQLLDAADRLSAGNIAAGVDPVQPLAAHTSNGGILAEGTALLRPTITAGRLGGLNEAMDGFEDQVGATVGRVANDVTGGNSTNLSTAAARANDVTIPGSLAAFADDTENAARQVYQAAETAANGAQVPTPRTVAAIDEILGEWGAVPGGVPGEEALRALRNELVNGPNGGSTSAAWTIDGLRRLRTSFGDRIESNQRQLREAANRLWGPLSEDIFRGLRVAQRPEAARLYRQADRQWARRVEGLNVIRRIIGRDADLSADAVAGRISSMSKNDYDRLADAFNLIDPAQANGLRGALINSLGEALPSRALNPGEFSLESFATRWNKLSPQARGAIFAPQTVRDLSDLARLAGSQRATNRLGNSSRSGVMNENFRQMRAVVAEAGVATSGVWNPTVWLGLVSSAVAGRLLASPGFARTLVRGSESRSIEVLSRRLSELARRTPAAAQEILGFRDALVTGQVPPVLQTGNDPFAGLPEDGTVELPPAPEAQAQAQAVQSGSDDPFAGLPDDEWVEF